MRIRARQPGVLDGINLCASCNAPMVKVASELRCIAETEAEELVATGLIPSKDSTGKITFDLSAKDQQQIQITQALSRSVELDDGYLQKLGLDIEKIRQYQLKHNLVA